MHKFLKLTCLVLILLGQVLSADPLRAAPISYYPQEFYRRIESGAHDFDLKQELFNILSSVHIESRGQHDRVAATCPAGAECRRHFSLGYTGARRTLFGKLHLIQNEQGYAIRDVYCGRLVEQRDAATRPPAPGQIPDPHVLNAEHTWPQSRFSTRFDRDLQKSDLHILYPVMMRANSSRGNIPFGDVTAVTSTPCPGAARDTPPGVVTNRISKYRPPTKGNAARAIFYFSVRYNMPVGRDEEDSLRAWHRADPPDADELSRNAEIAAEQNVRNPFVDYPQLVELISDF